MENIDQCIQHMQQERNLSPASISNYRCILKQAYSISKSFLQTDSFIIEWPILSWKILSTWIQDKTVNTRKNWLIALTTYIQTCIPAEERKEHEYIISEIRAQVELTCMQSKLQTKDKKTENYVPEKWNQVCQLADTLWTTSVQCLYTQNDAQNILHASKIIYIQNAIICSIFTLIPPRRSQDYSEMVIVNDIETANTIPYNAVILNEQQCAVLFSFKKYKTCKKYGQQIVNIPENIQARIRIWISICLQIQLHVSGQTYFLLSPKSIQTGQLRHITAQSIGNILRKYLGLGIRDIRKAKITHTFCNDTSTQEKEHLAADMGHSVQTQQQVYRNEFNMTRL